ncbi:acyl-CoA dehydrogenase (plasmid) [Rhodococcus erythropolis]|uniref:acyl-CoA dehydrogenase family protein n=1 Tax=Rhodococcus TaxID=1827 RepID=UPI0012475193|nr:MULTISPECIES: acyl-CoA dehydrogenase family protein [Rhodococcus]MCJ0949852.1 acyl-CoA dehydrogenase family protein [Rhodococcus sp. ARC_M8]MDJ0441279.1 acyl-CoA dehydrogenase family protein [Rhodococcus qingshengii]QEX08482.1 acyl-CoA dehydrogenase [Rhodococcus erythropolis]
MRRHLYDADHQAFREVVAEFVKREVVPHLNRWDEQRFIDRDTWIAAGKQGIVGLAAPENYGGGGGTDYRFRAVVMEEFAKVHATALSSSFSLQDDIAIPYIKELGNQDQLARWMPSMATGELIGAIAMTEPGTGSDLKGIRTSATKVAGGWLVNGSKTLITNGIQSDIVITVARTDPEGGVNGFSLLVVERDMPGFIRGRKLQKIGLHAQDTAELVYEDVFVPEANVLGRIGSGFGQLKVKLPLERLSIAVHALAVAESILRETITYVRDRTAFGQRIADFQNTQFELAEIQTEVNIGGNFVDQAILALNAVDLVDVDVDAAQAKWWSADLQNRVVDRCLQLRGGYGFMIEYPVARAYQDARIQRIFDGTNEIMKQIIGRSLVGPA